MDLKAMGPWLHNIRLPDGRETAPDHVLGDWPRRLWRSFAHAFDEDLSGRRILDIGCNAGFYTFELAQRGAEVVGLEPNPRYLRQARAVAQELDLDDRTEFRQGHVYDIARWKETFDVVLFLGVFYHLRYPLLGLDLAVERCRGRFVFQTLMHGPLEQQASAAPRQVQDDLSALASWPSMAFVEGTLFGDPTNWWVPQAAAVAPMLRSAGLVVEEAAGDHVFLCQKKGADASVEDEARMATGRPARHDQQAFWPAPGTLETARA